MKNDLLIQKAEFNPKIKTYLLVIVAFVMFSTIAGIPFLLFWFCGLGQYICKRYYNNLKCRLTDKHLIYKKGVLVKVEKTIPLENIQDLTFLSGPILSWFGIKILKIETAGGSKPQSADMKLIGIVEADAFKDKVLDQRELLKSDAAKMYHAPVKDESNAEMINILKDIKILLEEIKKK